MTDGLPQPNPTKKPPVPAGFQAVWVSSVYARLRFWVTDFTRRPPISFFQTQQTIVRGAHWRIIPISKKAPPAKASGKLWSSVLAWERQLQEEYDLSALDPVYRYHHATDVVRVNSNAASDPLHGLVWGTPFTGDNVAGTFNAVRVWYVVRDMNLDRYYCYARSAHLGKLEESTLQGAKSRVEKLKGAIEEEYEEKAYMELVRWVGWTAFGGAKLKSRHKKFRKVSKERGFDFDEKKFRFYRKATRWEREQAQGALRGVSGVPPVLGRDYGGSYSRFKSALARLSKAERKRAYEYLSWAVGRMEKALDKRRKARKPGKWRE